MAADSSSSRQSTDSKQEEQRPRSVQGSEDGDVKREPEQQEQKKPVHEEGCAFELSKPASSTSP
ncbi:7456_t:CDS:2 [Paraglomus occultum]|uniref:7456_t:CDS:1 n=1 Tax=Paraglomus occultum TaxID=144539 RepID=A0A9N8WJ17_9GLOM|nr:7456_t:CDS:2 [Paraglomus occultum]